MIYPPFFALSTYPYLGIFEIKICSCSLCTPEVTGGVFLLIFIEICMVAAPGMFLVAGKTLKEAYAARTVYLCDSCAIFTRPIKLASSKKGTAAA